MIKHQVDEVNPETDIPDTCSCTTCDSMDCFAYRQKKCCSHGVCEDPKTKIVYEIKKIDVKESRSNSSTCIADVKIPVPTECAKMNAENPSMDSSKYAELEKIIKDKLEKLFTPDEECCRPCAVEHIEADKNLDKELDSIGNKLSAQIMNLAYKDFKQTLSYNRSDTAPFVGSKLSKYDILQKIKEVYKACSCKICECLVGKATRNDLCKCKPCECSDCMSSMEEMKQSESIHTFKDCCACNQFDKTFAGVGKKITDNNKVCSCIPCECIECAADYLMKSCNCAPCQCIECKSMLIHKTAPVIVAPVVDDSQRNSCQCSPCECVQCESRYGLSSHFNHEMSTGTNRQRHPQCRCDLCQSEACAPDGVGSCNCDKQSRVMRKPVERDAHEYDIRTVLVNYPTIPKHNEHDAIAMFTVVSNNYLNFTKDKKQCTCSECKCLDCSYKEDAINAIKSSQLFTPANLQLDNTRLKTDEYKCQRCECEICNNYKDSRPYRHNKCLYEMCDCINCIRRKAVLNTKQTDKSEPNYCLYDNNCDTMNSKCEMQRPYKCMICNRCLEGDNLSSVFGDTTKSVSTSQNTSIMKSQQESLSIYNAFQTHDYPRQSKTKTPSFGSIKQASMSGIKRKRIKCPKTFNIIKCDTNTQYKKRNTGLYKNNPMEYKASGSYYSDSSSKTNSKSSSYYKKHESVTPVKKSCASSCNSSGYDYPDYLMRFPKSTVETCLKDVMTLNLDKKIKLDKLKITPDSPIRKRCANSTTAANTILSGKQRLSQGYDIGYQEIRKYNKYYKPIDAKPSSQRKLKSKSCKNKDSYTPPQLSYSKKVAAYKKRQPCYTPDMTRNKSNIKKNKCTQTLKDQGDQESQTSIRNDTHRNLQIAKNIRDLEIYRNVHDYSVMDQEAPNMIQNDQFLWKCSHTSPLKNVSYSTDFFKIDEDYKRIENTLREAKAFSLDLIKILEKCEKDNKEFVSISEKLKRSSILNSNNTKNKQLYNAKNAIDESQYNNQYLNETEHELRQIHLENPSTEEKTSLQVFPKKIVYDRSQEENTMIQQTLDITNFNNVNRNHRLIMLILPQENSKTKKENETQNQNVIEAVTMLNIHKIHKGKSYKRDHRNYSKLVKRAVLASKMISVKNTDKNCPIPLVVSATTEMCTTLALQTEAEDNKVISTPINTTAVNEATDIKKNELNQFMRKSDAGLGSTIDRSLCTSIDKMDRKTENICNIEESTEMQTQDIEGRKPWPILKKNFSLVPKATTKSKGVHILPYLEQEVKEVVEAVSLQTQPRKHVAESSTQNEDNHLTIKAVEVDKTLDMPTQQQTAKDESDVRKDTSNIRRKSKLDLELKDPPKAISLQTSLQYIDNVNKEICGHLIYSTREDIERQIKDLLNIKLLQPIMTKLLKSENLLSVIDNDNRLPRIESSKSSCEALKASFLGVRRVSDHTVLVKWNLPREVTEVQGYELLVDGRAVQKMFGPSKCMAVITCLPHTDKILLTIRTITDMVALTGHYPATSIVYHPRIK